MKFKQHGLVVLAVLALTACGKKEQETVAASTPPQAASVAAPLPDVGKVDTVATTADGYGSSPGAATADAMKTAILQVNGATIDTSSVQVKYGLDVTDGVDTLSLRATQFAERVAQKSGGAITNFKLVSVVEPKEKAGQYKVTIEANIAHFTAPSDSKKIKVVVGGLKFDAAAFQIGGQSFSAAKVASDIRQQVATALTNTGRFSILDRESDADIDNELAMIKSGAAPRAETGKLGQAVTADLIWAGHIDTLAYERHARQLRTSDRELVSYSGGWAISQKLVNVATRQVLTADALQGKAPDVAPTTMGSGVNSAQVLQDMETAIARDVVAAIVARTFPITVVSIDGNNVVLSQGGQSVTTGARYAIVSMGKELKDPQTGESLGRVETPCCVAVIDKVTPKLSYAHLEQVTTPLNGVVPASLQLRELVKPTASAVSAEPTSQARAEAPAAASPRLSAKSTKEPATIQEAKEDGKW
jgi:curli biogenesis system outer membrane secretion channel CsgG